MSTKSPNHNALKVQSMCTVTLSNHKYKVSTHFLTSKIDESKSIAACLILTVFYHNICTNLLGKVFFSTLLLTEKDCEKKK